MCCKTENAALSLQNRPPFIYYPCPRRAGFQYLSAKVGFITMAAKYTFICTKLFPMFVHIWSCSGLTLCVPKLVYSKICRCLYQFMWKLNCRVVVEARTIFWQASLPKTLKNQPVAAVGALIGAVFSSPTDHCTAHLGKKTLGKSASNSSSLGRPLPYSKILM